MSTAWLSRRKPGYVAALLLVAGAGWQSADATILFSFNDLKDGENNASVDAYMQGVLTANGLTGDGNSVVVSGSKAEQNYTGDDYVVGPLVSSTTTTQKWVRGQSKRVNGSRVYVAGHYETVEKTVNQVTSVTLGNTENATVGGAPWTAGATDTYIVNSGSDRITITFDFDVYAVKFDYEIFPNAQCPDGSKTSCVLPDFTFQADGGVVFHQNGVMPGTDGTYSNSPVSLKSKRDKDAAPQYLGMTDWWYFPGGVTTLEFIDWPVMIGIDNLWIDPERPVPPADFNVPEPATLALFGLGLVGLPFARRRRAA